MHVDVYKKLERACQIMKSNYEYYNTLKSQAGRDKWNTEFDEYFPVKDTKVKEKDAFQFERVGFNKQIKSMQEMVSDSIKMTSDFFRESVTHKDKNVELIGEIWQERESFNNMMA